MTKINACIDQVEELKQRMSDLEISLTTAIEHGDLVEDQLFDNNDLLRHEIRDRVAAEKRLEKLVELITQQKGDLEILVDTVVQHSDAMDFSWLEQFEVVEHASLTDVLTGIANRRAFDVYYSKEWKRAIRNTSTFSLIMFDIDFFKKYNDCYGHLLGDECLQKITGIATKCVFRPADMLARYGGEEFIVILPNTSLEGAHKIANELLYSIENAQIEHSNSEASEYVTISIGVDSIVPKKNISSVDFLNSVDRLLYAAKESGRNRVVTSTESVAVSTPKLSTYGHYLALRDYQKTENLSLSFIPSSVSINQRWRNNGLSADFLADYMTTFFPNVEAEPETTRRQVEMKCAVSFIANELLENVMKYTESYCVLSSGINLYLDNGTFIFESYNYIDETSKDNFIEFISRLENGDPEALYIEQIEENVIMDKSGGLGYLTMINDYGATAAWRFLDTNKDYIKVNTQIIIHL